MRAVVVVPIRGFANVWKVAESSDPPALVQERMVELEIQGNEAEGYHLIVSPTGCFTADTWHESVEVAKDTAKEAFGVSSDEWTSTLQY